MRKLSFVLISTASLALVGMAAAPALAELRISIGPPSYSQPTYGYYGYNRSPYAPYYGNPNNYNSYYYPGYSTYRNRGYTTYSSPYSNSYDRYDYPGYYQR